MELPLEMKRLCNNDLYYTKKRLEESKGERENSCFCLNAAAWIVLQ